MEAAVGDQEGLAAAFLAVDDPGQIDPRLADQPAAELDRESGIGERILGRSARVFASAAPTAIDVERLLAGEIGDAEAAAEIDLGRLGPGVVGNLAGQRHGRRVALRSAPPPQAPGDPAKMCKPAPVGASLDDPPDQRGRAVMRRPRTGWRGRPSSCPAPLMRERRIDPHRQLRLPADPARRWPAPAPPRPRFRG